MEQEDIKRLLSGSDFVTHLPKRPSPTNTNGWPRLCISGSHKIFSSMRSPHQAHNSGHKYMNDTI